MKILILFLNNLRRIYTIIFFLLLINNFVISQILEIDSVLNKVIIDSIDCNYNKFSILSGGYNINFQKAKEYKLLFRNKGKYSIDVICDLEQVEICLLDNNKNLISFGKYPNRRHYKRIINEQFDSTVYYLIVGSSTNKESLKFKFAIHDTKTKIIWRNEKIPILKFSVNKIESLIDSNSYFFEEKRCAIYKLDEKYAKKNEWIKINCESEDFDPFLLCLDTNEHINVFNYDKNEYTNNSQIFIEPKENISYLIISSDDELTFKEKKQYNPEF